MTKWEDVKFSMVKIIYALSEYLRLVVGFNSKT
jgi:hypothetical protein